MFGDSMRLLVAVALLAGGCTCEPERSSRPEALSVVPVPAPVAEPELAARPAPARPPAEQTRAFLERLRRARALARSGQNAEAYEILGALVRESPARRRLRCEAGYVAFRAARVDDAERDIAAALDGWPDPPMEQERVPLAMCLYNRALVAEARGDREAAATALRRSIELRPNAAAEQRLAALGVTAEAEDEQGHEAPTLEALIEELTGEDATADEVGPPVRSASGRSVVHVTIISGGEDEPEHIGEYLLLSEAGGASRVLVEIEYERYFSWYDDHAEIGEPRFVAGPPELGEIIVVRTGSYGRGSAEDSSADELYSESTLQLCAERRAFACAAVPIASTSELDCESVGGCEGDEGVEDDGEEHPRRYRRGYVLEWSIDGAFLVLEPNEAEELTDPRQRPRTGRIPLVELLEQAL
jgi:tetratricopeptide (TPR) repeat protein